MDVTGYISNQLNGNLNVPYSRDYLGSIQLLENSGFNPFSDTSPLNSTLYQIFNRFVEKTGLNTDANTLKDEFLEENPSTRQAVNLYGSLENTFAIRNAGEQAAIVDFLNQKIDDFITEKDTDDSGTLTQSESKLTETLFQNIDSNRDEEINAQEMENNFYSNFTQLNNVLNYFQNTPGTLINILA